MIVYIYFYYVQNTVCVYFYNKCLAIYTFPLQKEISIMYCLSEDLPENFACRPLENSAFKDHPRDIKINHLNRIVLPYK